MQNELSRRDLGALAARVFATTAGAQFFSEWLTAAEAHQHSAAPPEPNRWTKYQPKFFSPEEFRILDEYSAILVPTDDTPGAREAHVSQYLDFFVNAAAEYAPEMQRDWHTAMKWLTAQNFHTLSPADRLALVQASSAPERDRSASHDGFSSYKLIKTATIRAYYTSRAGLIDNLEYKGLAYLTAFPACDHPEHKKA